MDLYHDSIHNTGVYFCGLTLASKGDYAAIHSASVRQHINKFHSLAEEPVAVHKITALHVNTKPIFFFRKMKNQ